MTETKKLEWTCPNCLAEKFDSQTKMINHALACKPDRDVSR